MLYIFICLFTYLIIYLLYNYLSIYCVFSFFKLVMVKPWEVLFTVSVLIKHDTLCENCLNISFYLRENSCDYRYIVMVKT